MKTIRYFLILAGVLLALPFNATARTYDYPFADRYVATVLGTPEALQAQVPVKIPRKVYQLEVFPDRQYPDVLFYSEKMKYSLVYQKQKAPLIFMIAGTGANFDSQKMRFMERAFYQAGFHVISIASPTHPHFLTTASRSSVPGRITDDASDLYRVMELALKQAQEKKHIEVSEFYLTGYSLGASDSAFVARLDEERKAFNFQKVLLINPSVSLINSVTILDTMLEDNLPPGGAPEFIRLVMSVFSEVVREQPKVRFDENFLYEVYKYRHAQGKIQDQNVEALIGLSFRISAANMVFTSDVMNNYGYIKPANEILRNSTPLTDYFIVAHAATFMDYVNQYAYPYFKEREPDLTKDQLFHNITLTSISDYLKNSPKIGMMTNEDDIILAPGEVDFLRKTFGDRAQIYPKGGHCGNMEYPDNVTYMVNFFKQ
jgi:pimeloyl-ACP methyl ester carboxylesterase